MDYDRNEQIKPTQDWGTDIGTKIPLYDSTATDSVVAFDVLDEGSRPKQCNFEVNYGNFRRQHSNYMVKHIGISMLKKEVKLLLE